MVRHHAGQAARGDPGPMKRRFTLAPEEGWLTLGLVLLLCLTLAWSVDGARYVLGRDEYLDFLADAAAGGVLVGFIGPKVGWGRWLTFLIGSMLSRRSSTGVPSGSGPTPDEPTIVTCGGVPAARRGSAQRCTSRIRSRTGSPSSATTKIPAFISPAS